MHFHVLPMELQGEVDNIGTKKMTGTPGKVMWYFPPIPRFRRRFQSSKIVKDLIWHTQGRDLDDKMCHPADSLSWLIDHKWPNFVSKPRNLRLPILANGIHPHNSLISKYSCLS